jgi:hypothetical protein
MGAYCTLNIRRHPASLGEIMEVRSLFPYDDAALGPCRRTNDIPSTTS